VPSIRLWLAQSKSSLSKTRLPGCRRTGTAAQAPQSDAGSKPLGLSPRGYDAQSRSPLYIYQRVFMTEELDGVVSDKFCRLSTKDAKTKQECVEIFRELAGKNPELMLKKLVEITGMTEDQLTEIMLKSCPACPE